MGTISELVVEQAAVMAPVAVVEAFGAVALGPSLMVFEAVDALLAVTTVEEEEAMLASGAVELGTLLTATKVPWDLSVVEVELLAVVAELVGEVATVWCWPMF